MDDTTPRPLAVPLLAVLAVAGVLAILAASFLLPADRSATATQTAPAAPATAGPEVKDLSPQQAVQILGQLTDSSAAGLLFLNQARNAYISTRETNPPRSEALFDFATPADAQVVYNALDENIIAGDPVPGLTASQAKIAAEPDLDTNTIRYVSIVVYGPDLAIDTLITPVPTQAAGAAAALVTAQRLAANQYQRLKS